MSTLYTIPNPPRPILLLELKLFVATRNSLYEKRLMFSSKCPVFKNIEIFISSKGEKGTE